MRSPRGRHGDSTVYGEPRTSQSGTDFAQAGVLRRRWPCWRFRNHHPGTVGCIARGMARAPLIQFLCQNPGAPKELGCSVAQGTESNHCFGVNFIFIVSKSILKWVANWERERERTLK